MVSPNHLTHPNISIKPGDTIKIKNNVILPKYGWGRIKHTDTGVVQYLESRNPYNFRIDFKTQPAWLGNIDDIVKVNP